MDRIYDNCCGIDVHKKLIVACFRKGNRQEVREFGATTRELLELADWLQSGNCEMTAMESTASYWKPLYNILESSNLNAMVVNARHMKAVPGRKTDVKDAEWIADLLQHGLLQPSYIPDKDQRELRELVRYRKSLVGERTRELNRLRRNLSQNSLAEQAKISLRTVSDIENYIGNPQLETLYALATYLHISIDAIFSNQKTNPDSTMQQIMAELNSCPEEQKQLALSTLRGLLDGFKNLS